MRPSSIMNYRIRVAKADAKFFGNIPLAELSRPIQTSYLFNFKSIKFCIFSICASLMQTFKFRVCHVFFMCAKKKVAQSYARFVVTAMKNVNIIWDRAIMNNPCSSMSIYNSRFKIESPVAFGRFGTSPNKTRLDSNYFRPKSDHDGETLYVFHKEKSTFH